MSTENYWTKTINSRLSRRRALAVAGGGAAAAFLAACGEEGSGGGSAQPGYVRASDQAGGYE